MRAHATGGWLVALLLLPSLAQAAPGPVIPVAAWSLDLDLADAAGVATNLAGDTFVAANAGGNLLVWSADALGQPAWVARVPGLVATGIAATLDGGAVVSAYGWGDGPDAHVLGVSREGEVAWDRSLGVPGPDYAWGIAADARSIVVAGSAGNDAFAAALDASGTLAWTRHVAVQPEQRFTSVAMLPGGSAVLAGWTYDGVRNRALFARLSGEGAIAWQGLVAVPDASLRANSVAATPDGQPVVAGVEADGARILPWVARLDGAGKVVWQRTYGTAAGIALTSIAADPLGGAALAGTSPSPLGSAQRFLARMGSDGTLAWSQRADGADPGTTMSVALHPGGALTASWTSSGYLVAARWLDIAARPR